MSNNFLIGTKKNGCYIDNDTHVIQYFNLLSLSEKLSKKKCEITLKYNEIIDVEVTYTFSDGIRMGLITVNLIITTFDSNKYNFQILFMNTERKDIEQFIKLLLESNLKIRDPHDILYAILNSDEKIATIIEKIDSQK